MTSGQMVISFMCLGAAAWFVWALEDFFDFMTDDDDEDGEGE